VIQLGGNLWQASTPDPVADGDADPREFVLLYKGKVQRLAYAQMDSVAREADRELKNHQYQIAQLINDGQSDSYETLYLEVQDKAAEVDILYKEIDPTMMRLTMTPLMKTKKSTGKRKTSTLKARSKRPNTAMAPSPNGVMTSSDALIRT